MKKILKFKKSLIALTCFTLFLTSIGVYHYFFGDKKLKESELFIKLKEGNEDYWSYDKDAKQYKVTLTDLSTHKPKYTDDNGLVKDTIVLTVEYDYYENKEFFHIFFMHSIKTYFDPKNSNSLNVTFNATIDYYKDSVVYKTQDIKGYEKPSPKDIPSLIENNGTINLKNEVNNVVLPQNQGAIPIDVLNIINRVTETLKNEKNILVEDYGYWNKFDEAVKYFTNLQSNDQEEPPKEQENTVNKREPLSEEQVKNAINVSDFDDTKLYMTDPLAYLKKYLKHIKFENQYDVETPEYFVEEMDIAGQIRKINKCRIHLVHPDTGATLGWYTINMGNGEIFDDVSDILYVLQESG